MKIIGLEEHFVVSEVLEARQALDPRWQDLKLNGASLQYDHTLPLFNGEVTFDLIT